MMRMLRTVLNRFRRSERGSWVVEMALMFPLLTWSALTMITYFDAFLAKYQAEKSSSALADMMSRENAFGDDFIDYMAEIQAYLSSPRSDTDFSIAVVRFDEDDDKLDLRSSVARAGASPLTEADLNNKYRSQVPIMADNDYVFIIRTKTTYDPIFSVYGLREELTFDEFIVMRPRAGGQICYLPEGQDPQC